MKSASLNPETNGSVMHFPLMKPAEHPCWNIEVPPDLISPRWRRSCGSWFLMLRHNPLRLLLICSLCLVVLYKAFTAINNSHENLSNVLLDWLFRGCFWISGLFSYPCSRAPGVAMSVCCLLVGWSTTLVLTEISQQLMDVLPWHLVQISMAPRSCIPMTSVILRLSGKVPRDASTTIGWTLIFPLG